MMKRLSKRFQQLWCEATTACQPEKTLYLVQPSLTVHPLERFMKWNCSSCCSTTGPTFTSDAGIQGWLLPGLGNISLQREGASIVLVWRNKRLPRQSSLGFVWLGFLCILVSSPSLPFSRFTLPVVLKGKKQWAESCVSQWNRMLYHFTAEHIRRFPLKGWKCKVCVCANAGVCVCVCVCRAADQVNVPRQFLYFSHRFPSLSLHCVFFYINSQCE